MDITPVETRTEMMCPYRTETLGFQRINNGVPESHQLAKFMPCYGASCPFYEHGNCLRVNLELGRLHNIKVKR